ncbi:MAG: thiol peroxidase [Arcobacteraceae bacterium]|nr:thiol peroxidase [Arcobacteraceae bacterium]
MATTNFKGTEVQLSGNDLSVGDMAPVVTAVGTDLNDVEVGGAKDQVQLLISVPSLDTATCAAETRRFNLEVGALDICTTTVISMDLPFASSKFCSTEGIDNLTVVSDFVEKDFGKAYGVLMADNKLKGLLARTIYVVDRSGEIVYKQIVPEVTDEPNYDEVLEAIKDAR